MSIAHRRERVACPGGATRPGGGELAAVSVALTAYNVALNHVPFPGWSYVPANLGLAAALARHARRRWGLGGRDLGLTREGIRPGLALGALVAAAAGAGLLAAPAARATRPLLGDARASDVARRSLAYHALVRIPLGTALAEELLFRGVLLAAARRRRGELGAALASSAAFGAWHVGPTIVLLRRNGIATGPAATAAALGATVAAATGAGLLFCLLRRWGRGLLAPVLAHAAFNGLSLWAAARFQAREAARRGGRC